MLSRVADSLYWMSRYFERANHCARVLEANYNLMLNPSKLSTEERWQRIMASLGIAPEAGGIDPQSAMDKLTSDAGLRIVYRLLYRGQPRECGPGSRADQFGDVGRAEQFVSQGYKSQRQPGGGHRPHAAGGRRAAKAPTSFTA